MSRPQVSVGQKISVWEHARCGSRVGTVTSVTGRSFEVRCDDCQKIVTAYYNIAQIWM